MYGYIAHLAAGGCGRHVGDVNSPLQCVGGVQLELVENAPNQCGQVSGTLRIVGLQTRKYNNITTATDDMNNTNYTINIYIQRVCREPPKLAPLGL